MTKIEWGIGGCIVLIVAAIIYAACRSEYVPDTGIVVRKVYAAERAYSTTVTTGKVTVVTPYFCPSQCGIVIQADNTTGDEGQYYVQIGRRQYDEIRVGDRWNRLELNYD